MWISKTHIISVKVIALFTVAILSTFMGEYFHYFFGDWKCTGSGPALTYKTFVHCNYTGEMHGWTWHWGYRHWLYFTMCLTLFILQGIDITRYAQDKYGPHKSKE